MTTVAAAINQPFNEAVAYFRQKTDTPSAHWTAVMDEAHARAFAVAGATKSDLIADFRAAVDKAISQGQSLGEFRKNFDEIVKKHGWSHTGDAEWRARIIYQTNLANAFSAGRYAQQMLPSVLRSYPYLEYVHVSCPHPRLMHMAWSGTILPANDPWWDTHYTPNGWGCHCLVMNLGPRDLARRGIDPTTLKAPPIQWQEYIDRTTGVVVKHPAGIDPGFAYNPGKAWKDRAPQPLKMPPLKPVGAEPPVLAPPGKQAVALPVLEKFLADPQGSVQVGQLSGVTADHLGTGDKPVLLSAETAIKQLDHHPDLSVADYAAVEQLIAAPDVTLAEDLRRVRLMGRVGQRALTVLIKRTGDGNEAFLLSLHSVRAKNAKSLLKRDKLLSGDVESFLDWLNKQAR